ncbi:MAG: hypothetical protein B7Y42_14535 [Polaromonas sp. 28-63-22]|nr:MAG: hypothetical protein B7Y42_14535 [Polaromonas sp. 28-63-22]
MLNRLKTIARHLWLDADDTRRAISPSMLKRLTQRVAASERRHSGEVRICVEASLPLSYLRRLGKHQPIRALARQRAVMMFSKLRVWDTEHNNGVLIYLLLAEQAIEVVADRGIARHVSAEQWHNMVAHMSSAFKAGRYEDGLTEALAEISAVLMQHFALDGAPGAAANPNELPDNPLLM